VAIGAGRARVMRQLLAESIALSLAGGILGVVLARFFVSGLLALAPAELARNASIAVDYRIVLFAVGISFLTGVAFGLGPTLMASRTDVARGLQESGRSAVGGSSRLRSGLVAAEVALSVILLAGAGLLFQTLIGLQAVDPGLNPARVLTFNVQAPAARYRQPIQAVQFYSRAVDGMAKLPGVESASAVSYLPFTGLAAGTSFSIDGRPPAKPGEEPGTVVRTVLPGYFHTIGIPLLKGRVFTAEDNTLDSPYRFVVNRALVQKYFATEDPLGRRISVDMDSRNPFGEIIGVVGDVKEGALDKEPQPTVYYVHAHLTYGSMTFVLRAKSDPLILAEAARGVVRGLDPALPVAQVRTMESVVRETFARQRFSGLLLAAFSLISLVLAAVGLYGVLAYSVTERTREIGVRLALGAEPRRIMAQVLRSGLRVVIAGIVVGIAGASALTGLLRSLLFGVGAHDFTTFASVPLALLAVAMLASYVPARRAARTAPAEALRAD
jgi:putative ABC transport system permease protein